MKTQNTTMQKMSKAQASSREAGRVFVSSKPAKPQLANANHLRVGGNPIWAETMSYCLDAPFASSVGLGQPGDVYWGIKIEAAALAGRNTITDVQLFVTEAATYTMSMYSGAEPTGTAIATQALVATDADTMTWKTIHFATPVAIPQGQDLWVTFYCNTVNYPAAGVTGTEYDNGKYVSLDGTTWELITASNIDYTWMIRAISDTFTPQAPAIYIDGPLSARTGDTVSFSAVSPNANSYAWSIVADYVSSTNTANTDVMWSTVGTKQVAVAATNSVGTSYDTLDVEVYTCENLTIPYAPIFTDGLGCWDNYSYLEQNFGWFTANEVGAGEGQLVSLSMQLLFGFFPVDVDVDNWAVSPVITMPATGEYEIAYKVKPFAPSYPGDHYGVYVISGTDSTLLYEESLSESMTDFVQRTVVIPSTVTGDFKFAFRHFNSAGGYAIVLDDIQLRGLSAPEVTLAGPAAVENGVAATFTANCGNAQTFTWTVDGAAVAETSAVLTHTFTTDGNHTVAVEVANSVGNDSDSMTVEVYTCNTITAFPYSYGFEEGLRCWNMVSVDPANDDNFGLSEDEVYEGNYSFQFSSYSSASDYNQYLISPEFQLPETGSYMADFFYMGYNSSESFKVLASTTTNDISSFTELADFPTVETSWTEVSVALPAGTKYVAINYYGNYQYYLYLDNFQITALTAPTVTVSGPQNVGAGNASTFTAVSPLATSFAWTVDGSAVASTTNTMTYTFTTAGNHTVAVTASNSEGSATASMDVTVFACDAITAFPYVQNFENVDDFGCWNFVDADGDGYNWDLDFMRGYTDESGNPNPQGHNGSDGMVGSASYINGVGALTPDNWMITPALVLPSNADAFQLSWYVKAQDGSYSGENYSVYVATGNAISDFTNAVYTGVPSGNEWEQQIVNLSSYAGQTIYIAFRHYNVTDMYWIDIDDIAVGAGVGIDNHDMNISVYPNPATNNINVCGEGIQEVQVMDINGRTLMTVNHGGQINIGALADGMYLVRVVTENGVQMNKIVKR